MNQPAMKNEQICNGVNVTALTDTIAAIQQNNALAEFQFRAANQWVDGGHNRSTIQDFYGCEQEDTSRTEPFVLDADEPPVLLGRDLGPNPVEFVLHGLAGCMTTSMVYHAAARGIEIGAVNSEFEGDLDLRGFLGMAENVRKGYQQIRVTMRVKTDTDSTSLRECMEFSPVYEMISRSLPVNVDIQTY
ncbi:MAG: OsmC family protein [Pseudomonadales bacterium]